MDGGMVNIRQQGWKEMKVGAIYDVALRLEYDQRADEYAEFAHAQNMAYTAVLGDEAHFAPALWALAVDQHLPTAQTSSVTSDGAEWIWNLPDDLFPDSSQIVDWFHACQHLSDAASALFPVAHKALGNTVLGRRGRVRHTDTYTSSIEHVRVKPSRILAALV